MGGSCHHLHRHPNQEHHLREKNSIRWGSYMINDKDVRFRFLKASEMGLGDLGRGWGREEVEGWGREVEGCEEWGRAKGPCFSL
jgi:hypothetical protein